MAREADPLSAASRWRPRPARLRCLRPSGEVETYAVPDGRRAWSALRKLIPSDVLELVGEDATGAIVGRWGSPTAAAVAAAAAEQLNDDPPNDDAASFRWALREVRGVYADQLKAGRECLSLVLDALKVQREALADVAQLVAAGRRARTAATEHEDDDQDDDREGFAQVTSLLRDAFRLYQAEHSAPATPIEPPRDSTPP
jgi:hypothetical protein